MSNNKYRVLVVASHPVQYAAPVFRVMAQHPKLDIVVAYCSMQGAEAGYDPGFDQEIAWDIPLLDGYSWIKLENQSRNPGLHRFWGLNNFQLWKLIHQEKFDAVIVLTGYIYFSFWIALAAAKATKTPILFGTDSHQLISRDQKAWKAHLKRWIWFYLFNLADMIIVPSSGGIALMRSLGLPEEKLVLTPYVVDNDWWIAQSKQVNRSFVRQQWGIPADAVAMLFCAKLQPWKRPHDVLEAFIQADTTHNSKTYLIFAGDGPLQVTLEQQAAEAGMAGRVKFLGFVNQSQLPPIYTASDLLVLPSDYEPFGVVVNEAMLCGCPVIVSDRVGARYDLVRDEETGFVYPSGNVNALTEILQKLLPDADRISQMGKMAHRHMATWSPEKNVEALVEAIEKQVIYPPNKSFPIT